jgi:hypothetical protein
MSLWSRIANVFRSDRLNQEIDEELKSHVEEAIANGRDPDEIRKAFGVSARYREESRDFRLLGCLDSVRTDLISDGDNLPRSRRRPLPPSCH